MTSGYLTLPARAEEEATSIDRVVSEHAAEKAQAAFLEVATTATLIKLAKSKAHELNQNDRIWQAEFDEKLLAECLWLTKGDVLKAQLLASAAKEG